MSIRPLVVTEEFADRTTLRFSDLDNLATSIETWVSEVISTAFDQIVADVFHTGYTLNEDGAATLASPIYDIIANLSDDNIFSGNNTFQGDLTFESPVTSSSTFTSTGQFCAKAYLSINQSIPTGVYTGLNFAAESFDVGSLHDLATNPSRITVVSGGAGLYSLFGQVKFDVGSTKIRKIAIYKNGSLVAESNLFTKGALLKTEETVTVTANVGTLANLPVLVQSIYASTGGTTGGCKVLPSTGAVVTGSAKIDMTTGAMTFFGADAVTEAIVTYLYDSHVADNSILNIGYFDQANEGDYYELKVYQDTGSALNVISGAANTFFSAVKNW